MIHEKYKKTSRVEIFPLKWIKSAQKCHCKKKNKNQTNLIRHVVDIQSHVYVLVIHAAATKIRFHGKYLLSVEKNGLVKTRTICEE